MFTRDGDASSTSELFVEDPQLLVDKSTGTDSLESELTEVLTSSTLSTNDEGTGTDSLESELTEVLTSSTLSTNDEGTGTDSLESELTPSKNEGKEIYEDLEKPKQIEWEENVYDSEELSLEEKILLSKLPTLEEISNTTTTTNVEIKKEGDDIPELEEGLGEGLKEGLDEKSQAKTGFIEHLSNNYEQMILFKNKNKKYIENEKNENETEDEFIKNKENVDKILALSSFIFLMDYNFAKMYLLNKIKQKADETSEDLENWIMYFKTFVMYFPMEMPSEQDSGPQLVYEEGFSRKNMIKFIGNYINTINNIHDFENEENQVEILNSPDKYKEKLASVKNAYDMFLKKNSAPNLVNIHTMKNISQEIEKILEEDIKPEIPEFKLLEKIPGETELYSEKNYENLKIIEKLTGLKSTKHFGGININNLIEPSTIVQLDKDNKTLGEFVDNLNKKFKELNEEFCINCDREQQLIKLNKVFNVNNMDENELYEKYDISVRDLLLCVYLNMIEYIENSLIKDKYKLTFIDTIESVINEHILYSIWFFIFSKYYVFEEFKTKINNGKCEIEGIIRYIRHKEKIKFSKINEDIYQKFYKNILTKFVYNIKINRDYYNSTKTNSIKSLVEEFRKNKYDYKYFSNKQEENKMYRDLVNVINIKNNIEINNKYNKNIIDLLDIIVKIIVFYRNLYIYVNDICKFYSINNLRTKKEVKYNINNFASYLNIKQFMKKHSVKNKKLMIDNEIIVCKSIKDFNKYINKLVRTINKLDVKILSEKWDLIKLKLKKMNIFTDFEIECIKLIVSNNYNNNLLKKSNQFINNYSLNKKLFKKHLSSFKVDYKNITQYNYNIDNISTTFTGIEFEHLIKINNCLGHFNI